MYTDTGTLATAHGLTRVIADIRKLELGQITSPATPARPVQGGLLAFTTTTIKQLFGTITLVCR